MRKLRSMIFFFFPLNLRSFIKMSSAALANAFTLEYNKILMFTLQTGSIHHFYHFPKFDCGCLILTSKSDYLCNPLTEVLYKSYLEKIIFIIVSIFNKIFSLTTASISSKIWATCVARYWSTDYSCSTLARLIELN